MKEKLKGHCINNKQMNKIMLKVTLGSKCKKGGKREKTNRSCQVQYAS